ncbi:hypothetical protein Igag_0750 [Ignisphaera aggregans DSM 17230]|uniref:Uncharacterized protein n=1 Tax=Ignisphaera aggregans (strain DSM 17230 / JCM 13409 / AQ1.S1) TaxID=583356 RepID=E0STA2_IGNAA|nr:hypothetical protein Igag_0750 [Ignisphaera aggregans DSM 17230]
MKVAGISYFNAEGGGIWIIIDPPMSYGGREPWYIGHRPYGLVKVVKP